MILDEKYLATPYRCAVYFVPDIQSSWWQAGSAWLGRCAATGKSMTQPQLTGISPDEQWKRTSDPRRYGWHATLKAPFKIGPGENLKSVMSVLQALAEKLPAFDLPAMQVKTDGGFIALRPKDNLSLINATADACVKELHSYAAPLSEADLERRRQSPLTPKQDRLLVEWSYPYVFEEFNFHFSLTNKLDGMTDEECAAWVDAAQLHFSNVGVCRFDRLALFVEPMRGADFELFDLVEMVK